MDGARRYRRSQQTGSYSGGNQRTLHRSNLQTVASYANNMILTLTLKDDEGGIIAEREYPVEDPVTLLATNNFQEEVDHLFTEALEEVTN